MAKLVNFDCTKAEGAIITKIVERGWAIEWLRASYEDKLSMRMDVQATHANGNPLRLADLLAADDFNFAHDMSGICNCLDRNTGKLTRDFSPRFTDCIRRNGLDEMERGRKQMAAKRAKARAA